MTDTQIADGVLFPQDDGTGVTDGNEDATYAALLATLARYEDDSYVDSGLGFNSVVTTDGSEEFTLGNGLAFVEDNQSYSSGKRNGRAAFGFGSVLDTYDTELPDGLPTAVILPTSTTISLETDATVDVYLYIDPTVQDGSNVFVRHGSAVSTPSNPSILLGTINTADGTTNEQNRYRVVEDVDDDGYLETPRHFGFDSGRFELFGIGGPVTNSGASDGPILNNIQGSGLAIDSNGDLNVTSGGGGLTTDADGDSLIEPDYASGYLGFESERVVMEDPNATSGDGFAKDLYTHEQLDIYVDADNGSDTGAGTSADPYETLARAWEDIPFLLRHTVNVNLADATNPYTLNGLPTVGPHISHINAKFRINGNTSTPSNVKIGVPGTGPFYMSFQVYGSSPIDSLEIQGVDFDGAGVQVYGGQMGISDSYIRGATDPAIEQAVAGYGGHLSLRNVTRIGENASYAFYMNDGKRISMAGCDITASNAWVRDLGTGGIIHDEGTTGPQIFESGNSQSVLVIQGPATIG